MFILNQILALDAWPSSNTVGTFLRRAILQSGCQELLTDSLVWPRGYDEIPKTLVPNAVKRRTVCGQVP